MRCDPTLESLRQEVFATACAWNTCHGPDPSWGLSLVAQDLSAELVDVPSGTCRGWKLVVPGSPDQSFLWRKLSDPVPPCGEPMPRGLGPLPPQALSCVKGWIESLGVMADGSTGDATSSDASSD